MGSQQAFQPELRVIHEEMQPRQSTSSDRNIFENTPEERWKNLLEIQNQSMMELVQTIRQSVSSTSQISLPNFNPDAKEVDARAWCLTADLCMERDVLKGSYLMNTLSRAMKESAASWFPQVSYAAMT